MGSRVGFDFAYLVVQPPDHALPVPPPPPPPQVQNQQAEDAAQRQPFKRWVDEEVIERQFREKQEALAKEVGPEAWETVLGLGLAGATAAAGPGRCGRCGWSI